MISVPRSRLTLTERKQATDRTLAKFSARSFDWHGASCIHLARTQAVNMGHHVPMLPAIRSAIGAATALRKTGHGTLVGLLDSLFPRITPAFALIGDLCALSGEDEGQSGFSAICLCDGQGNLIGWHGLDPSRLSTIKFAMGDVVAAWRL